jgi:lipid-A-disaccharide synthase
MESNTSDKKSPLIFISTGDLSGDMHAGHLVERLKSMWGEMYPSEPPLRFTAAGADHLANAGAELWEDTTLWGAIGIFEGIKKLPMLLAAKKRLIKRIKAEEPDLIITVDYRAFNMSLLKEIRYRQDGSKRKTAYYIAPVIWWKPGESNEYKTMGKAIESVRKIPGAAKKGFRDRFEALAELVDIALVAYPFSLDAYEAAGVNFKYIGHPLGQIASQKAAEKKYLEKYAEQIKGKRLVCIAPGSRLHELRYHMPVLKELVARLMKRYIDLWFYCPVPSPQLEQAIRDGFELAGKQINFVPDDCYDLMAESDLMIVKSGTSVQLALLLAVPAVTFYKITSEWMVRIGKRFFQEMPFYAFPNLLAKRMIVPEFVQSRFTLPNIYVACTELLDDPAVAGHMRAELSEVRRMTMEADPVGVASGEIIKLIGKK